MRSQEQQPSVNEKIHQSSPHPTPGTPNSPILLHFIVSRSERGNNKRNIILVLKDCSNANKIILTSFSLKLEGEKTEDRSSIYLQKSYSKLFAFLLVIEK